ncbi:ATP-binding protein [Streptomyces parvulus]|uniref:sensor histidine kinase n=1 Tax=Streptomyces parvulus TaxID=146923 RepID=UPI001E4A180F|nr:ATP-binding protein [Streptomyces parvulus]MCC9152885.1 ATP-binding protein [Streptomyces parvulus]MCE7686967.1 ATP-binding protein [Streptomyces parvulus]
MRTSRTSPGTGADTPARRPARGRRAHAGPPADESPGRPGGESTGPTPTRAWRGRLQPRTVRAKIVCLLMVPVVSLLALWAYATVTTAQDISRLRQVQRVDAMVRAPVGDAVAALQAERLAAVRRATDPSAVTDAEYRDLIERSDRAVRKLRLGDRHTVADGEPLPAGVARRLDAFVTGAEQLKRLRSAVIDDRGDWQETHRRYTTAISAAFRVGGALSGIQDADLGSDARVLVEFARAGEALAQEDALLAGARLAGGLDGERLRLFTGAVDTRRNLTESAVTDLSGSEREAWQDLARDTAYTTLRGNEDSLLAPAAQDRPVEALAPRAVWDGAHARVRDGMRTIESDAARQVADRADPFTRGALTAAGAAVLFGLLAVADLTHLLAEIIENAAQFSPPHTRVRVTGEPVGNGYAVEIEDRGLGMGKDALAEANHRIIRSEALDLFDSDRLGLFVVSRLAARQDIKVHLKTSPYGGTTAVVLVPTALLHSGTAERTAQASHETGPPGERRHARVHDAAAPRETVSAPSGRPVLTSAVPASAETAPDRPPGAPALRLHLSPDISDDPARGDGTGTTRDSVENADDLPRRIRQASLAPQLRDGRPAQPARPPRPRADGERTPEVVRDRMTAYRDGWARGGGRRPGRPERPDPPAGDSSEGDLG